MATTPLRSRKAVLLFKIETTAGVDAAPTLSNAVYVEVSGAPVQPSAQRIQTNYVAGSLDKSASLLSGVSCTMSFTIPVASAQPPGVVPDWDSIMQVCGFTAGVATRTALVSAASTISFTSGSPCTIGDSGSGLAAATIGTVIYVLDPNGVNSGEYLVTASAAGSLSVTKTDGTAAGITTQAAGAGFPITISYGVPGTVIAATSGSTTGFTGGAAFTGTVNLYRHMPVLFSTSPVTPAWSFISNYTAAKAATIADLLGSALTDTTKASIPANVTYLPTSTSANLKTGTAYLYVDGVCWQAVGLTGNWDVSNQTAQIGRMTFQLSGIYQAKIDAALPAYTAPTTNITPIMRAGSTLMNRIAAACKSLTFKSNNQIVNPPNPNAVQGFDPGVILSRKFEGAIDPQDTLVATRDTMGDFINGYQRILHCRYGSQPGGRVGYLAPTAKYLSASPSNDGDMQRLSINFECNGTDDNAFGFCVY